MKIENLTGHKINLVDKSGNVVNIIPVSIKEEPLRANITTKNIYKVPYPISKIGYETNYSKEKLEELAWKYDYIIVSKISAEVLIKQGYKGGILITGRKFYLDGEFKGTQELSLFN